MPTRAIGHPKRPHRRSLVCLRRNHRGLPHGKAHHEKIGRTLWRQKRSQAIFWRFSGIFEKSGLHRPRNRGFLASKPRFRPLKGRIGASGPPAENRFREVSRNFRRPKVRSLAGDGAIRDILASVYTGAIIYRHRRYIDLGCALFSSW